MASPHLAPAESAQSPGSAKAQTLAAAGRPQGADQQLSHIHADAGPFKEVLNNSSMPDSLGDCSSVTDHHVAAEAHPSTLLQQHECAEPKTAAGAVATDSISKDPPATQLLSGQALLSKSPAEAPLANTVCADSLGIAEPARLLYIGQQFKLPQELKLQTAEPLQVRPLVLLVASCPLRQVKS